MTAAPALAAALVAIVGPQVAGSSGDLGNPTAARPIVEIVLAGGDASLRATFADIFRRSLAPIPADLRLQESTAVDLRSVASEPATRIWRVKAWLDLTSAKSVTFYATQGRDIFVRRIAFDGALDAVVLETVNLVVVTSVDAMLSGRQLGVPREEFARTISPPSAVTAPTVSVPAAPPAEPPAAAPFQPPRIWWAASYHAQLARRDHVVHGPGVDLQATMGTLMLGSSLTAHVPGWANTTDTRLAMVGGKLAASAGIARRVGSTVTLAAGLGIGLDAIHVAPESRQATIVAAPPFWSFEPVLTPAVTIDRAFTSRARGGLRVGVVAGLDVDLRGVRYVIAQTTEPRPVWRRWRWRPELAIVVGFDR